VVQPRHGSFPELLNATGGGILVTPDDPQSLAEGLRTLLEDTNLRRECGLRGQAAVNQRFNADAMATATIDVLKGYVK
jgi:glycosyltransferase involved in cell wall biosynthesis